MIRLPDTLQEVFDIVSKHLLNQRKRSVDGYGSCSYRGIDGMKCAAGILIPDDQYDIEFERKPWISLVSLRMVEDKFRQEIFTLQCLHDANLVENWEEGLKEFAINHNLEFNCTIS